MNREDFPMLYKDIIYFDNGATTFKPKCVIDKINEYYRNELNRVFDEFWRDNWEIILKKFHNPTINFKTLNKNKKKIFNNIFFTWPSLYI